jgi:hypothetical protein
MDKITHLVEPRVEVSKFVIVEKNVGAPTEIPILRLFSVARTMGLKG